MRFVEYRKMLFVVEWQTNVCILEVMGGVTYLLTYICDVSGAFCAACTENEHTTHAQIRASVSISGLFMPLPRSRLLQQTSRDDDTTWPAWRHGKLIVLHVS